MKFVVLPTDYRLQLLPGPGGGDGGGQLHPAPQPAHVILPLLLLTVEEQQCAAVSEGVPTRFLIFLLLPVSAAD